MYRHGIVGTLIVAGDNVEIFCSIPEFIISLSVKFYQTHRSVIIEFFSGVDPFKVSSMIFMEVAGFKSAESFPLILYTCCNGFSFLPAALFEVVGNTANGIGGLVNTDFAVFIEINAQFFKIAWHKLAQSDSTGKRSIYCCGIKRFSLCHSQVFTQFIFKELVSSVFLKSEGGKRIEYRVAPGVFPIMALYADNSRDILGRYAVLFISL